MKIKFNGYTYFDPNDKDKNTYTSEEIITHSAIYHTFQEYAFNHDTFNKFIADRRYQDAANYAAKFHFDDPKIQQEHENDIYNLRREGRKIEAIYSKFNDEDLTKVEFIDNVFSNGGLENIQDNEYAKKFIEYKNSLFSKIQGIDEDGNVIHGSSKYLSMTFENDGKKSFLGVDAWAKDNDATIDNFYKMYGFSEAQLKSAGVNVINKDGKTSLIFDGANSMANKLIYSISKFANEDTSEGYNTTLVGVTDDKNKPAIIPGLNDNLTLIQMLIDDSIVKKDQAFQQLNITTKDYSSTIGPAISDGFVELNDMLAQGTITESQYKSMLKTQYSYIEEAIKTLGSEGFEMYSNAFNEEKNDETLISLDNNQRSDLISMISAADPKKLHFNAMVSNGMIGTLVTIDADRLAANDINDASTPDDISKTRRWQVFIPGLFQKEAQAKINRNTTTRAAQEINSMQDYGYGFKCSDGTEIYSDTDGKFYKNGKEILRQDAEREINKTMIVEDATSKLQFQYLNYKGELYDQQGYEEMARMMAIKAANELYPGVPLVDENNKPLTVDDIFKRKGAGPTMSEDYANNVQFDVYYKFQELFDIYDKIMNGLIYYK